MEHLMKIAKLTTVGQIVTQEVETLTPGPDEVLIKVEYAGVCGSDLHSFRGTHPFRHAPVVLGHELSGTVAEVGENVTTREVGDAVTVMPYIHCGECLACRTDQTNVCENKIVPGIKGWQGTLADYFLAPARITYELGPDTSLKVGALAEPFAVGIHSAVRAGVHRKSEVLILGGGTIGLVTAAAAIKLGARSVAVTDLYDYNLNVARQLGADHTYNALADDLEEAIRADYPDGFDAIFLTSGAPVTVGQAIRLAQRGARIVATAIFAEPVPLSLREITLHELVLLGTQIYTDPDFEAAVEWLDQGDLPYEAIITHVMPLNEAQQALELVQERTEDVIKVLLVP
jgi:L-iditol 2-dehydrogenase